MMGRLLAVDQTSPSAEVVEAAVGVLVAGGVVVMPTDSVYGIGCAASPGNPAHERVFEIKQRERSQTLPWLVASPGDLTTYGEHVPAWAKVLAGRFWPGALTLVVRAGGTVDRSYVAADGTIALRVPGSPLVRALAASAGPLAVTSANVHGEAAATSGDAVDPAVAAAADLVLDAGPAPIGVASTIVDATGEAPRVLREGAISSHDILVTAREAPLSRPA